MANFVAGILGGAADGGTFTGQAHRLGMASHATIVGGAAGLQSRPGIIQSGGTPLNVVALGTPAMKVNVKAGTCVVQSTSASGGVFTVTLATATDLDIAAAHATNPRIDLVVATVFADGSTANCFIEVITGTPGASPARPSISSPPTNTHYFPLAQVRVEATVTTIVAGKVTKLVNVDGLSTVAPGGLVPVSSTTDAGTLPPFTPYMLPTGEQGIRHPNGTSLQTGNMMRFFHSVSQNTGVGAEFNVIAGVWTNGSFVASPFPNGCTGAMLFDATNSSTFNEPIWYKLQIKGASNCTFKAYRAAGVFASATVDVSGIAWGW